MEFLGGKKKKRERERNRVVPSLIRHVAIIWFFWELFKMYKSFAWLLDFNYCLLRNVSGSARIALTLFFKRHFKTRYKPSRVSPHGLALLNGKDVVRDSAAGEKPNQVPKGISVLSPTCSPKIHFHLHPDSARQSIPHKSFLNNRKSPEPTSTLEK